MFKILVENYADINKVNNDNVNCLIVTAMYNSVDVLPDLIQVLGATGSRQFDHQDSNGDTALIIACNNEYLDVITLLLTCPLNFDVQNNNGDTALLCLCNKGIKNMKCIELVVSKADVNLVNNDGLSAIVIAARQEDYTLMKLLVDQGRANLNICNKEKETALCIACERKNFKIAQYLLEHGADPNLQSSTGFTGLLHACQRDQTKIAKLLLSHGADPNLQNIAGYTALVWASIKQNIELVTELLNHSADPNVQVMTYSRYSALTWAMIKNDVMVIKKLLYHGADPYLRVNNGKISFDYLNISQKSEVVSYYARVHRWHRRKSFLMFLVYTNYLPLMKNSHVVDNQALKYERVLTNIHLVQIICAYV